jgi:hypothetical protein
MKLFGKLVLVGAILIGIVEFIRRRNELEN